jgi:hypothetical protein
MLDIEKSNRVLYTSCTGGLVKEMQGSIKQVGAAEGREE